MRHSAILPISALLIKYTSWLTWPLKKLITAEYISFHVALNNIKLLLRLFGRLLGRYEIDDELRHHRQTFVSTLAQNWPNSTRCITAGVILKRHKISFNGNWSDRHGVKKASFRIIGATNMYVITWLLFKIEMPCSRHTHTHAHTHTQAHPPHTHNTHTPGDHSINTG